MFSYTHPAGRDPLPVCDLLRRLGFSLTLRRKLKRSDGAIGVNGQPAAWRTTVRPGDSLSIAWPEESAITPLPLPLTIVYEDDSLLVVDKPAGLLVHPTAAKDEPSLANAVVNHLGVSRFHPVHRLDRNTSGLLIVAKNPYIQHLLFSERGKNLSRIYLALVSGCPEPPGGTITAPIARRPGSIIERTVSPDGQPAVTHYRTISSFGAYSLLRLRLETGRTHQIRVHLAHLGHPILGDDLYGGPTDRIARQALHAAELAFIHPVSGRLVHLTSPLPPDIASLVAG